MARYIGNSDRKTRAVPNVIVNLIRALLAAVAAGVLPGYFWARFLVHSGGLAERLAYSAALSMATVPVVALLVARIGGTGVTIWAALAAPILVAVSGALACWRWGAAGGSLGPALPRPRGPGDPRALALAVPALAVGVAELIGLALPGWLLAAAVALLAGAGLVAGRAVAPASASGPARAAGQPDGPVLPARVRAPALGAVLALTAVLAYAGPVRHDWPYLRGMDMFSHAVMTEQMLAHGSYASYLVYPPGFSALSAVASRLAGLPPLALFSLIAPALLLLTAIAGYALVTRLWGWDYGLAAAALSGLVLVGPYAAFAGGLYPDLVAAFFLLVMVVAALVGLYQRPSVRSGVLVAVTGPSVVLYHSVGTVYLVLLLATVVAVCLPFLLLRGGSEGRALARAVALALAALGAVSVAYAWYIYDLGRFFDVGSTARATIDLDLGSQTVLPSADLLAWVGSPIIWLGVLGFAALAASIRRLERPAQVATALTVLGWCAVMYLGSRVSADGFPQRFERDVGAPLTALAALGAGLIVSSLTRLRLSRGWAATLGVAAATAAATIAAVQAVGNIDADSQPSREVLTAQEAAAGAWLRDHNTGGTVISTPDLRRGVTNRAVLAMGGYAGLQSYPLPKIEHPRSLPTAGLQPLLDSRYVLMRPTTCAAARIIAREDVRFIFLYTPGTEADYLAFRLDVAAYQMVFENSQIAIYAPRPAWLRSCATVPGAG
jgi:hypothetical protein